jgi:uroporphyrinogen-III synthase
VGPATAAALTRIGFEVAAIPEAYVGEAVVAMLREKVAGKRVLLARAAVARDVIPEELRTCGADIYVADAYQTVIPSGSAEKLREIFGTGKSLPDAVTFTSSSTVDNFFALLRVAMVDLPAGLRTVSIGPVTSQTLRRHGWPPAIEATPSDIAGLAAACVKLLTS